MPLHIERQEIAMMLIITIARNQMAFAVQSCPSIQAIVDENKLNLKDIITFQTPCFPPWTPLPNLIDTSLTELPNNTTSSHIYIQEFKNTLDQYSNFIKIYTDASKTESNVGIAIIWNDEVEIPYNLSVYCSIYIVEAIANLKALEYSLEKQNNNFVILSDSLSSIISIANTHKPNNI